MAVLAGRGARHFGAVSEAVVGGYPKDSPRQISYKCNKYPKRNFSHET